MGILLSQVDDNGIGIATWDELICALTCGGCDLQPGRYYRINYRSTYYLRKSNNEFITRGIDLDGPPQYDTFCTDIIASASATNFVINTPEAWLGAMESILVLAVDVNKIDNIARSEVFPQDEIHYDPMIGSSDYLFGKITYRCDKNLNISTYYDFRNIRFRRWNRTLDTIMVQPLSIVPSIAQIDLPIEIGPSVVNSSSNKFTAWFENDVLMSVGNSMMNLVTPIGLVHGDYFTFGGPIGDNVIEAANQPVNNSYIFYQNSPINFKNIHIGKVKEQSLCGSSYGKIPDSIASGLCSTTPLYGWESGSGPGSEPCLSASGTSGMAYVDYFYWKELNNIVFFQPESYYINGNLIQPICENITIGDDCIRGSIDGSGLRNIVIKSGFESNIIISNQPNNDENYIFGLYDVYTSGSNAFNVKSWVSSDFNNNTIGYDFKENLILMQMNNNNIGNNFQHNLLQADPIWYNYDTNAPRSFSNNEIKDNFKMNEITQRFQLCSTNSSFINNKCIALNDIPGDNLNRKLESNLLRCNFSISVNDTVFTLMTTDHVDTVYRGMIKLTDCNICNNMSFQATSSFETILNYPNTIIGELNFNDPSYLYIGGYHLIPTTDPNDSILPLEFITGDYTPDNFNLYPVAFKIKNISFMLKNTSNTEFIKSYNIVDNSIDLLSVSDYFYSTTPGIISNDAKFTPFKDSKNRIWVGYTNGVSVWENNTWTTYNTISDLGGAFDVNFFYEDTKNRIWIGHNQGVSVLDDAIWYYITNTMTKIHFSNTVSGDFLNVISILEDSQNRIWLGTNGGGVSVLIDYTLSDIIGTDITKVLLKCNKPITLGLNTYIYFKDLNAITTYSVTHIHQDKLGNIYFGTNGVGVSMIPMGIITRSGNDITTNFTVFNTIAPNYTRQFSHTITQINIIDIKEDSMGNVYFATPEGVSKKSNTNWTVWDNFDWTGSTFIPAVHRVLGSEVNKIVLHKDILYTLCDIGFSTFNGTFIIHNAPGVDYNIDTNFNHYFIDKKDNLWLSTDEPVGSASVLNTTSMTLYGTASLHFSPLSSGVVSFYEDLKGNLYFGSNGYISQFDGFSWDYYTISSNDVPLIWIYEDISTNNYSDWVLGLTGLDTNKYTSSISDKITANTNNISLATDILDLWSKSNDWTLLSKKTFLSDTNAYNENFALMVYLDNPADPSLANYTIDEYNFGSDLNSSTIMSALMGKTGTIYMSQNSLDIYKLYPMDIDQALDDYLNNVDLYDYQIAKVVVPGNLTSPITSMTITDQGSGYTMSPEVILSYGNAIGKAIITSGSISSIIVLQKGSGYVLPPTVTINGNGIGATADAVLSTGVVSIILINGGSGYNVTPLIDLVGGGGSGATAVALISGGAIVNIIVTAPGSGYTSAPTVVVNGFGGGAVASCILDTKVVGFTITNGGSGYSYEPTITIGGDGIGAEATVNVTNIVDTITLDAPGSGYNSYSTIATIVGLGTGASAQTIVDADPMTNPLGQVTSINLLTSGSGYLVNPDVVITGAGTNALASTTITGVLTNLTITSAGSGFTHNPPVVVTGNGTISAKVNTAINEDNILAKLAQIYAEIPTELATSLLSKIYLSPTMLSVYGLPTYNGIIVDSHIDIMNNEMIAVSINNKDILDKLSYDNSIYDNNSVIAKSIANNKIITITLNVDIESSETLYYQISGQNNYIK
jgi:hypothetical protein